MAPITFSAQANPTRVQDLFKKLATDDNFRAELARDPHTALRPYGVELPAGASIAVPPKDKVAAFLKTLETGPLSGRAAVDPHLSFLAFEAFFM